MYGANNAATGEESASISAGGTAVFNSETEYVQSGFTQGNESTSTPNTNTNILWGAAATAILGATLADWQRRREEEEARKRAEAAAQEEEGGRSGKKKTPGQRAYEKMMKQKRIVGESQALLNEKEPVYIPSQKLEDEETNWLKTLNPVYQYEKRKAELQKKAELQAGLSAYYEGRKAGEEKQIVYLQKITRTGGLYGPPIIESEITPEEIEDGPPEKNTPPRIQTHVEALGIAVDVAAYISYYEVPKLRADYSGTVNLESIDAWNPTPAPIPHQNPGPSELWLEISNVQVINSVNENIYIQKIDIGIGSIENQNFVNRYVA